MMYNININKQADHSVYSKVNLHYSSLNDLYCGGTEVLFEIVYLFVVLRWIFHEQTPLPNSQEKWLNDRLFWQGHLLEDAQECQVVEHYTHHLFQRVCFLSRPNMIDGHQPDCIPLPTQCICMICMALDKQRLSK